MPALAAHLKENTLSLAPETWDEEALEGTQRVF